jgi:glycosyltransferase involved in cell wall biosynthesis
VTVPTFSVVMAAYNASRTIGSAIGSVLAQTRDDFELIVVDDGSSDDTVARVEAVRDPRVAVIAQANTGPAGARNAGIEAARGRFVSMIDSDDLWLPTYLEAFGGALEDAQPEAGFAYGDAWALEDTTRRIRRGTAMSRQQPPDPPPVEAERFLLELIRRNFVFTATTVRRDVLAELGAYDASLQTGEDYELWLRIVANGYRAVRVPGLHAIIRDRPGSLSHDDLSMLEGQRDVYRRILDSYPVTEEAKGLARQQLDRYEAAVEEFRRGGRSRRLRTAARAALGSARRRLLARRRYLPEPPPEVARAFPDLTSV